MKTLSQIWAIGLMFYGVHQGTWHADDAQQIHADLRDLLWVLFGFALFVGACLRRDDDK